MASLSKLETARIQMREMLGAEHLTQDCIEAEREIVFALQKLDSACLNGNWEMEESNEGITLKCQKGEYNFILNATGDPVRLLNSHTSCIFQLFIVEKNCKHEPLVFEEDSNLIGKSRFLWVMKNKFHNDLTIPSLDTIF
jgi:hypothetical protein